MTSKKFLLVLFVTLGMQTFAQDADMTMIPYRKGDLWGYASSNKEIAITPQFQEAQLFYEGYAVVKKNDKYGYINKSGKIVIPAIYFAAKPFRFGYYAVSGNNEPGDGSINSQKTVLFAGAAPKADGYEICIDAKGVKIKCPAINENSAPDLNKANTVTAKSSYNVPKSEVFDNIVDDYKMAGTEDTYYIATRNNNFGVINNKYEVVVPFEYSKIEKLNIGAMNYVMVDKNGMKGILFGNGSPYMAIENTKLLYVPAKDGKRYFIYAKDGKTGLKNNLYANIVEPIYDDVSYDAEGNGFVLVNSNYKGYAFSSNNTILQPRFTELKPVKGGEYVMVKNTAGKWGYISKDLVEFFED